MDLNHRDIPRVPSGARLPSSGSNMQCIFNFDVDEVLDVCSLARSTNAEGRDAVSANGLTLAPPVVSQWSAEDRLKLKRKAPSDETARSTELKQGGDDVFDIFRKLKSVRRVSRTPSGSASASIGAVTAEATPEFDAQAISADYSQGTENLSASPRTVGSLTVAGESSLNSAEEAPESKMPASDVSSQLAAMREAALKALLGKKKKQLNIIVAPPTSNGNCGKQSVEKEEGEISAEEGEVVPQRAAAVAAAPSRKRDISTASAEKEEGEVSDDEPSPVDQLAVMREVALKVLQDSKRRRAQPTPPVAPAAEKEDGEVSDEEPAARPAPSAESLAALRAAALQAVARKKKDEKSQHEGVTAETAAAAVVQGSPPVVEVQQEASLPAEKEEGELSDEEAPPRVAPSGEQLAAMREAALQALKGVRIKRPPAPVAEDKEEGEVSDDDGAAAEAPESRDARLAALRATALKLVKSRFAAQRLGPSARPIPPPEREEGEVSGDEQGGVASARQPAGLPAPQTNLLHGKASASQGMDAVNEHLRVYLEHRSKGSSHLPPPLPKFMYSNFSQVDSKVGFFRCSWCGVPEANLAKGQFYVKKSCFSSLSALLVHARVAHPAGKPTDLSAASHVFYREFSSVGEYNNYENDPLYSSIVENLGACVNALMPVKAQMIRTNLMSLRAGAAQRASTVDEHSALPDLAVNAQAAESFLSTLGFELDSTSTAVMGHAVEEEATGESAMVLGEQFVSQETENSNHCAVGDLVAYEESGSESEEDASEVREEEVESKECIDELLAGVPKALSDKPDVPVSVNEVIVAPTSIEVKKAEALQIAVERDAASADRRRGDRDAELSRLLEREADLKLALETQKIKEEIKANEQLYLYQGNKIADLRNLLGRLQQAEHEQSEVVDSLRKDRANLLNRAAKVDFSRVELLSELASTRLQLHMMSKSQKITAASEQKLQKSGINLESK